MADPTIFSYQLLDQLGLVAPVQLYVAYDGSTETVDALIGNWTAMGTLIDAATTSKIVQGSITIPLLKDGAWKSTPASGIDNTEVIVVDMGNAANTYVQEFVLPGYLAAMKAGGKVVLTETHLKAITDRLVATGGILTAFYQTKGLNQLTNVVKAFLTDRKRRNEKILTTSRP